MIILFFSLLEGLRGDSGCDVNNDMSTKRSLVMLFM